MAKKVINCPCGWSVNTEDEEELVRQVQQHAKEVHNMSPTRDEVMAMAQPE